MILIIPHPSLSLCWWRHWWSAQPVANDRFRVVRNVDSFERELSRYGYDVIRLQCRETVISDVTIVVFPFDLISIRLFMKNLISIRFLRPNIRSWRYKLLCTQCDRTHGDNLLSTARSDSWDVKPILWPVLIAAPSRATQYLIVSHRVTLAPKNHDIDSVQFSLKIAISISVSIIVTSLTIIPNPLPFLYSYMLAFYQCWPHLS